MTSARGKKRRPGDAPAPRIAREPPSRGRVSAERLIAEAEIARRNSYSPYSRFAVGAALLTREGRIVLGCNVENASFGLSICAERNALWRAVGEGERSFVAIAVTAGRNQSASPCGACRQALHEFAPQMWVYWRSGGQIERRRLGVLLAHGFDLTSGRKPGGKAPRTRAKTGGPRTARRKRSR